MRVVAIAFAALTVASRAEDTDAGDADAGADEYVKTVTDANFDEVIGGSKFALVEFYAPWCGHCKALAPKYEEAAKILAAEDPPILLAKCDAEKESKNAKLNGVKSFPTLVIYRHGSKSEQYSGERETDAIVKYMKENAADASEEMSGAKAIKEKFHRKKLDHVAVVGYFPVDGKALQAYMAMANNLRGVVSTYHVTDGRTLEDLGFMGTSGTIMVYRHWATKAKEFKVTYKGQIEGFEERVKKFVEANVIPELGYVPPAHSNFVWSAKLPIVRALVLEDDPNQKEHTERYVAQMKDSLEEFRGKAQFVVQDEEKFDDQMFDKDQIKDGKAIMIRWDGKRFQYKETEHGTVANFVKLYFDGKLEEFLKTQNAFPEAGPGEVQAVTGSTFAKYVMDETKDVLLESYAPWCGHCKRLEPEYEKLALMMKDEKNILIAKLDDTENDVSSPKYKAKGYPTIKFAPHNAKDSPIDFDGERTAEGMAKWIRSKATVELFTKEEEM